MKTITGRLRVMDNHIAFKELKHWTIRLLAIYIVICSLNVSACYNRKRDTLIERYHPEGHPKLLVIGVRNQIKGKEWQDLRIGFGLKSMLTESLYDTGYFLLQEEKPEIRSRLGLTTENLWNRETNYSLEELSEITGALNADVVAFATVTSFHTPTSDVKIGFFSSTKAMAEIEVKICLFDNNMKKCFCSVGKGREEYVTKGLLVEFQDDGRLSTKSLIGKASKQAMNNALNQLISGS